MGCLLQAAVKMRVSQEGLCQAPSRRVVGTVLKSSPAHIPNSELRGWQAPHLARTAYFPCPPPESTLCNYRAPEGEKELLLHFCMIRSRVSAFPPHAPDGKFGEVLSHSICFTSIQVNVGLVAIHFSRSSPCVPHSHAFPPSLWPLRDLDDKVRVRFPRVHWDGGRKDLWWEGAADNLAGWREGYKVRGRRHPHLIPARMIFPRAALIDPQNMAGPLLGMVGDTPSLVRGVDKDTCKALAPGPIHSNLLFRLKMYALIYARMCLFLSSADLHPQTLTKPPVLIMYQPQCIALRCRRETYRPLTDTGHFT